MGIAGAICFVVGIIITTLTLSRVIKIVPTTYLWIIMIIGFFGSVFPIVYFIPYFLTYLGRKENKKDWELITQKYNFNEQINLTSFQISCYTRLHGTSILGGLINTVLPSFGIKMIVTQSKEAENEVEIIYILPDNKTITEKFICFDNQKVQELETLLRTC